MNLYTEIIILTLCVFAIQARIVDIGFGTDNDDDNDLFTADVFLKSSELSSEEENESSEKSGSLEKTELTDTPELKQSVGTNVTVGNSSNWKKHISYDTNKLGKETKTTVTRSKKSNYKGDRNRHEKTPDSTVEANTHIDGSTKLNLTGEKIHQDLSNGHLLTTDLKGLKINHDHSEGTRRTEKKSDNGGKSVTDSTFSDSKTNVRAQNNAETERHINQSNSQTHVTDKNKEIHDSEFKTYSLGVKRVEDEPDTHAETTIDSDTSKSTSTDRDNQQTTIVRKSKATQVTIKDDYNKLQTRQHNKQAKDTTRVEKSLKDGSETQVHSTNKTEVTGSKVQHTDDFVFEKKPLGENLSPTLKVKLASKALDNKHITKSEKDHKETKRKNKDTTTTAIYNENSKKSYNYDAKYKHEKEADSDDTSESASKDKKQKDTTEEHEDDDEDELPTCPSRKCGVTDEDEEDEDESPKGKTDSKRSSSLDITIELTPPKKDDSSKTKDQEEKTDEKSPKSKSETKGTETHTKQEDETSNDSSEEQESDNRDINCTSPDSSDNSVTADSSSSSNNDDSSSATDTTDDNTDHGSMVILLPSNKDTKNKSPAEFIEDAVDSKQVLDLLDYIKIHKLASTVTFAGPIDQDSLENYVEEYQTTIGVAKVSIKTGDMYFKLKKPRSLKSDDSEENSDESSEEDSKTDDGNSVTEPKGKEINSSADSAQEHDDRTQEVKSDDETPEAKPDDKPVTKSDEKPKATESDEEKTGVESVIDTQVDESDNPIPEVETPTGKRNRDESDDEIPKVNSDDDESEEENKPHY